MKKLFILFLLTISMITYTHADNAYIIFDVYKVVNPDGTTAYHDKGNLSIVMLEKYGTVTIVNKETDMTFNILEAHDSENEFDMLLKIDNVYAIIKMFFYNNNKQKIVLTIYNESGEYTFIYYTNERK